MYLEWVAGERIELLRALRQGWRRLRTWPAGAWGLGGIGALAGWSKAPDAPATATALVLAAMLLLGVLPARLAEGDPAWLDTWLGVSRRRSGVARGVVAFLYAQGAVLPTAAALAVRHGRGALGGLLLAEALGFVGAMAGAALAVRWRGRAAWVYGPGALVVWTVVAGGLWS